MRRPGGTATASAAVIAAAALVLTLCGCSTAASPGTGAEPGADVALPPEGADFDYQLGGGYDPAPGVELVARDSTDTPAEGAYNVCYVNGFQTQPGESERWATDHPDLLVQVDGEPLIDENWPDEYILDTSSDANRAEIADLVGAVIASCQTAGFDAVEIDNLDSYTRADGRLTLDDNIALASAYAQAAHALGLAIGQKNGAGLSAEFRERVGFDFAVTEECLRYDECADYTATYGERVYDIEYESLDCAAADRPTATILRDLELSTPDDAGYVRESCAA